MNTILITIFLNYLGVEWQKTYGGILDEAGFSLVESNDSHYIILGNTYSFGNGGSDIYIIKINKNGDTLWTKFYGTQNDEFSYSIKEYNGNYIIVGNTQLPDSSESDIYILKINKNGNLIFEEIIETPSWEYPRDFEISENGDIIIAGSIKPEGGDFNLYVSKIDSLGNMIWQKRYGGNADDFGYSICKTENGYMIVGYTFSFGNGGSDIYLIKINENGDTLWTNTFGREENDYGFFIAKDDDGNYIICGSSYWLLLGYEICYMKISPDGNSIWQKYNGSLSNDFAWCMGKTYDNGYVITGNFGTLVWLLKTDSIGLPLWSEMYGGNGFETGYFIKVLKDTSYIIVGKTNSFGAGGYDVYVIKTTKDIKVKEKIKLYNRKISKELKIFDISGKKILKPEKKGIYFKILNTSKEKLIIIK
ncbi:MAG: hypothetical protein ABIM62_01845 [candidate division WOR-3 bacterium]